MACNNPPCCGSNRSATSCIKATVTDYWAKCGNDFLQKYHYLSGFKGGKTPNTDTKRISLSNRFFKSTSPVGYVIGGLSTSYIFQPHNADFTFALVSGDGDDDNGKFSIENKSNGDWHYGELKTNQSFTGTSQTEYSIRVKATDRYGVEFVDNFAPMVSAGIATAGITNLFDANTNVVYVPRFAPIDSTLGTFWADGEDQSATYTFRTVLMPNLPYDIAGNYYVDGDLLKNRTVPGKDAIGPTVRAKAINQLGESLEFNICVVILKIDVSNTYFWEGNTSGATIATLSSGWGIFYGAAYSLVSGDGDDDNALFSITGNAIKLNEVADYDTKRVYHVRVRATKSGDWFDDQLTFYVRDAV